MGFGTCCKALKGVKVACKAKTGEGITKNFRNTTGVMIGDIKTYEGGKKTSDRLWGEEQIITSGERVG